MTLWTLEDVTLDGRGRPRLRRMSVSIPAGRVAVLGASGSGKTSLLNLLVGYERPDGGGLRVEGLGLREGVSHSSSPDPQRSTLNPQRNSTDSRLPLAKPQPSTLNPQRSPLFWSPPDYGLWPHLTVWEHLLAVTPEGQTGHSEHLLIAFGLESLTAAYPASLSQGECSRLSVARVLAAQPRCLVLDEPLEHVDAALRDQCWRVLREQVAATSASLVFCTHSPERVLSEADWCLCLDQGQLVWSGSVEELYSRPQSPEIAAFLGHCNWVGEAVSDQPSAISQTNPASGAALAPRVSEQVASNTTSGSLSPTSDLAIRVDSIPGERGLESVDSSSVPPCLRGESSPSELRPVRPERLEILPDPTGPYRVESERFSGSVSEVELTQLDSGTTQRVYHRPARPALIAGQRVSLRIMAIVCAIALCLGQSGCNRGSAAEMSVVSSTIIRIPVDGKRMPAPRALTISPAKELYVLDDSGRILVYDPQNTLIRQWKMPESSVGKPEGIRVLQDGRVAIADTHYHRVVFFDQQGQLLSMFGSEGEKPGEFTYPVDLLQDPSGFLYVAEYGGKDRIQKFTPDGKFVLEFGGLGTGIGEFQRPSGMVWIDSKIYVADAINCRVQVFNDQGKSLAVIDWADQGGLYYPYDIALSPHGQLFFVEYGACRVSVANPAGKLVAQFGHEGRGHHELWTPWALAVSEDNRVFIADTGNRRIVQLTLPGGKL